MAKTKLSTRSLEMIALLWIYKAKETDCGSFWMIPAFRAGSVSADHQPPGFDLLKYTWPAFLTPRACICIADGRQIAYPCADSFFMHAGILVVYLDTDSHLTLMYGLRSGDYTFNVLRAI